ncbi:MAG: beta-ureidopropionase / N-carbamoyl-L-amino-acid hydrolase [Pseudonocardiales bacterium]|nr:beta-ureidopropionase / N-carbamoyl-L-amino-acid hydrolase [Pseudonocardiales bacterium]
MTFDALWAELTDVGREPSTGGYRRFAWTRIDAELREWFGAAATARGLDLVVDRCGNQWAWWGDADSVPGVVTGSHLDSVPDGGAFDGPLGVVSAFGAVDALRAAGVRPTRPLGVVNFADEEGARFGIACTGSRLLTGALAPDRALALRDNDGVTLAEALRTAGRSTDIAADAETLRRIGVFVELHVEQGRALIDVGAPVAVATSIWPHGRFRAELPGEANHAGTTALADRRDPTLAYAQFVLAARAAAERTGSVATCGKVRVERNGVNAIPARVTAWLDARGPSAEGVRAVVAELSDLASAAGGVLVEESWTDETAFDVALGERLAAALGDAPRLATGAGHDAGVLAQYGIPAGMLFVRNPTGVSHSPAEFAERADCLAGVDALTAVLERLLTGS